MGQKYIVCGYIECFSEKNDENITVIDGFEYEKDTPFPNIFSQPLIGYQSSMVSFAISLKDFDEDWENWRQRFEEFLEMLWAKSAMVRVESELEGAIFTIYYVPKKPIICSSPKENVEWFKDIQTVSNTVKVLDSE
jgi:hypothetical protein